MIHCLFFFIIVFRTFAFVDGLICLNIDTAKYGFSYECSSFSIAADPKYKNLIPTGEIVSFEVHALDLNCNSHSCAEFAFSSCSIECGCCIGYNGVDPGFRLYILAAKGETELYKQYFNCTVPPWVPTSTGVYFIYCNFSGYAMADPKKMLRVNLTWNTRNIYLPPYYHDVYIIAGIVMTNQLCVTIIVVIYYI